MHRPRRTTLSAMAAALLLGLLWASPAFADIGRGKRLGLGLGGGTLTSGLTAKYYVGPRTAVQVIAGNRLGWGLAVGADYLLEMPNLARGGAGRLFWGIGAGAAVIRYDVGLDSASIIAISGVAELGWHFRQIPLEFVVDWRPSFIVGDYLGGLYLGGTGGAIRWFF